MLRRCLWGLAIFTLTCALLPNVRAATVYDETVSGDLSNSGLAPTFVSVALGSNQIFGTTGSSASGLDRDYFTVTVPAGLQLSALLVLPGTTVGGSRAFIGIEAGNQVTVPVNPPDASGLLGWLHYTDEAKDILPEMGTSGFGSTGFVPPLSAGDYAFWVQEFDTSNYKFDLQLSAVPEPSAYVIMLAGFGLLGLAVRRAALTGRRAAR